MESNRALVNADNMSSNVVSLDEQRKLKQLKPQSIIENQSDDSIPELAEVHCEGDVCTLKWRPKRKAA